MNISEVSIKNPVFAWMLMFGLLLFGALSFRQMGISENPDIDFPMVNISVTYEGAAPEVMEKDVVDAIEGVVVSVEGIKKVDSAASTGRASITVEFELDKDIDVAVQEIQTAISRAQRTLPEGIDPPIVTKSNPEDRPIMWLAIRSSTMDLQELMYFVRNRIRDQFSTVSGVSEITLGGYVEPALNVEVNLDQLNRYQLTVDDVVTTIQREHIELPAGRLQDAQMEKTLRMMGEALDVEEFRSLQIKRRGGAPNYRPMALGDVAHVYEGLQEVQRISRVQLEPSVGLGIRKQRGANTVEVANMIKERAELVRAQLPEGVELSINYDSSPFIEASVRELLMTLIMAALLTAFVCWVFLGNLSSTANILFAIPTSVIGTFIIINAMGFTLNSFTLLGLTLAIGIVVDDAIIVLENIMRHRDMGKGKVRAALDGSKEIVFAVVATTAALVAIFLPVTFMEGIVGKFFFQFAATICIAVILSSVEALTLAPMRCSQFLQPKNRGTKLGRSFDGMIDGLRGLYGKALPFVLRHRWKTLAVGLAVFTSSLLLLTRLESEFAPSVDEGRLFIQFETKIGSSLHYTSEKMKEIETMTMELPYVERYFVAIGGFRGDQPNVAFMFVTLKEMAERRLDGRRVNQQEVASHLRQKFSAIEGIRPFIRGSSSIAIGGGRGFGVEFSLRGPDWDQLVEHSGAVAAKMEESGWFTDINRGRIEGGGELWVIPERRRATELGVEVSDISQAIRVLYGGIPAALYSKGGQRYDVRVQLSAKDRESLDDIGKILVRNNRGELVSLAQLVRIEEHFTPPTITREDRVRSVGIVANPAPGYAQGAAIEKARELAAEVLPEGYYTALSGSSESMADSFRSLLVALALGIIVAYMVLASQFNSFIDPLVVLAALPFAASGAFLALFVSGQTLNIYSMIGLILLMGIVKKNSILLVEFTNQSRDRGNGVYEALLEACPLRLRPIMMTSFATIAAALPAALNSGPGHETRLPMALVIIGGMFVSTLFTLFVVPCLYSLMAVERRVIQPEEGGKEELSSGSAAAKNYSSHEGVSQGMA